MKITTVKSDEERSILIACIVHDDVLATVHTKLGEEKRPFENKWSNTILQWCRLYFTKYQKAPRKHITQLFAKFSEKVNDEDAVSLIESFLSRLSKEYEGLAAEMNEKFLLDQASRYFSRVRLSRHVDALQADLENRDLDEAKAKMTAYESLDFSMEDWANSFDKSTIIETMRYFENDRNLIAFPGKLGKFLSAHFERDGFIAFAAPEKRGKSFWLLETVYRAIRQRRKVLYYVLGDMSLSQANKRLYSRITRLPMVAGSLQIPEKILLKEDFQYKVRFKSEAKDRLSVPKILEAASELCKRTASKELPFKIRCVGAGVISASMIEQDVKQLAQRDWVADVVVIDYADLLAPEPHSRTQEYRHQVNETWKVLRRTSLDMHCLVVTATQAAASSYDAKVIRKKDFSEDKRKNAHVTGMLGINQTSEEKKDGVYRLNWIFLRDGEWADTKMVWTAGNLGIACPCIVSTL